MKHGITQAATAALLLGLLPAAHAAPTLSLSADGGAPIYCADGAACDTNGAAGAVTYSQALGDFVVNVTTGLSKPMLTGNPLMDLNTVTVNISGGPHTLTIAFSDTGYDLYGGRITMDYGGTLSGVGASAAHSAYYDAGNVLFGDATLIGSVGPYGPGAFSGTVDGGFSPNGPYSVTEILTLQTGGGLTVFSGDFAVKVPEPTTLALVALGLLGFAAAFRRRRVPVPASRP